MPNWSVQACPKAQRAVWQLPISSDLKCTSVEEIMQKVERFDAGQLVTIFVMLIMGILMGVFVCRRCVADLAMFGVLCCVCVWRHILCNASRGNEWGDFYSQKVRDGSCSTCHAMSCLCLLRSWARFSLGWMWGFDRLNQDCALLFYHRLCHASREDSYEYFNFV